MPFQADALTRIKLCVLYLLRTTGVPLSMQQIVPALEPYDWIDRFSLAQAIDELMETGMIESLKTSHITQYRLCKQGENTLTLFRTEIPLSIRRELELGALSLKHQALTEAEYLTDYHQLSDHSYLLSLKIMERGRPILSIELELASRGQANEIAENWKKNANSIYAALVAPLLRTEDVGKEQK